MRRKKLGIGAAVAAGMVAAAPAKAVANPDAGFGNTAGSIDQAPSKSQALVREARSFLGIGYNWGGRNTKNHPGLDCLGLVFLSIERVYGISWKSWSIGNQDLRPSLLLRKLGGRTQNPIHDISNESPKDLLGKLKEGDTVFFLSYSKLDRDTPMAKSSEGNDLYGWHVAVYAGNGKIIHASPFSDGTSRANFVYAVVEEPLFSFMQNNSFRFFISTPVNQGTR